MAMFNQDYPIFGSTPLETSNLSINERLIGTSLLIPLTFLPYLSTSHHVCNTNRNLRRKIPTTVRPLLLYKRTYQTHFLILFNRKVDLPCQRAFFKPALYHPGKPNTIDLANGSAVPGTRIKLLAFTGDFNQGVSLLHNLINQRKIWMFLFDT